MSPATRRLIGVIFMVAAAVLLILNLKRVADLGTFWVGMPLFIIGLVLTASARRGR